ncbi:MAG: hypothetical protein ACLSVS_10860, partial [Parasutterella excrementihominis]
CIKGRTGPVSLCNERRSKAAVSRNPKRPTAALSYGRCRGGMESSPFMTRRTSRIPKKLISALTFVRSWEALYEQKKDCRLLLKRRNQQSKLCFMEGSKQIKDINR